MKRNTTTSSKSIPLPLIVVPIYGIWSKKDKKITYVSLQKYDVELEYAMEGYSNETHVVVCLKAIYDVSSLERLVR